MKLKKGDLIRFKPICGSEKNYAIVLITKNSNKSVYGKCITSNYLSEDDREFKGNPILDRIKKISEEEARIYAL